MPLICGPKQACGCRKALVTRSKQLTMTNTMLTRLVGGRIMQCAFVQLCKRACTRAAGYPSTEFTRAKHSFVPVNQRSPVQVVPRHHAEIVSADAEPASWVQGPRSQQDKGISTECCCCSCCQGGHIARLWSGQCAQRAQRHQEVGIHNQGCEPHLCSSLFFLGFCLHHPCSSLLQLQSCMQLLRLFMGQSFAG